MTSNTFTTQYTCRLSIEAYQRKVAGFRPDLDMQEQAFLLKPTQELAHQASLKQMRQSSVLGSFLPTSAETAASSPDALHKNLQFVLMATAAEAFAFRAKVIKVHCKTSSAATMFATKTYFVALMKDLQSLIRHASTEDQVATFQHCRKQMEQLRLWGHASN